MSTHRALDRICAIAITVAIVFSCVLWGFASGTEKASGTTLGYEQLLFDASRVHTIDIVVDDWDTFIANCENEEYVSCAVVIDGDSMKNVAIRAKGNTSLSNVRQMGSQRYSFKIEFDHYQKGRTYHGLDKLCLNNLIQDNTMMKDFLSYQMMADFGVDAPLCSYVYIRVNGEDWGLYLAVEGVEDSFLARNYGSTEGDLYKPDSMSFGGGRGNGAGFDMGEFDFSDFKTEGVGAGGDKGGMRMPGGSAADSTADGSNDGSDTQVSGDSAANGTVPATTDGSGASSGMPSMPNGANSTTDGSDDGSGASSGMPFMPNGANGTTDGSDDGSGASSGFRMPGNFSANGTTGGSDDGSGASSGFQMPAGFSADNMPTPGEMPEGGFNMMSAFGFGSSDVKLQYSDDDPASYSNIFNNAKTKVTEEDQQRLISAIKDLNENVNIETTVDTQEVLRYFVVHNFVCNGDSYTGAMIHNYYLYEEDGQLSMIPWDYNLGYGTFEASNASGVVNTDIDSPVSGGSVSDRPMFAWIVNNEEYLTQYHELMAEFVERWFGENGKMSQWISELNEMLRPYVEKDPTKFCTLEEYDAGVVAIDSFMTLRAESISRQLAGDTTRVDTGDLDLSVMGSMNSTSFGGGEGGGFSMPDMPSFGGPDANTGATKNAAEGEDANTGATKETAEGVQPDAEATPAVEASPAATDNGSGANAGMPSVPNGTMPTATDGSGASSGMPSMPDGATGTMPTTTDGSGASSGMPSMPDGATGTMPTTTDGSGASSGMPSMPDGATGTMPTATDGSGASSGMPSMPDGTTGTMPTTTDGSGASSGMPSMPDGMGQSSGQQAPQQ